MTIDVLQRLERYGLLWDAQLRVVTDGAVTRTPVKTLKVSGATEATVLCAFGSNYRLTPRVFSAPERQKLDPTDPRPDVAKVLSAAERKGYAALKRDHLKDFGGMMGRVTLDIPDKDQQRFFQFGRYLLVSSSRPGTLPANLQGVWCAHQDSPWGNGYWHNINVQMNYWPAFSCNLAECFEAYAAFNAAFRPSTKVAAWNFVKRYTPENLPKDKDASDWWCVGTAVWPYVVGGGPGGHSGPGTGGLTTKCFMDWWEFTRDERALRDYVWPTVHGMADFLTRCVVETNGLFLSKFSASPEQIATPGGRWDWGKGKGGPPYYVTTGCAFDQQMIWENNSDLLKLAEVLGTNDAVVATVRRQIDRYDPVQIGESGQLKEYREERKYGEIGEYCHRHISQLVALYPGALVNRTKPDWMAAARSSLTERGDKSTGWALAHRICCWARLGDGNHARKLLVELLTTRTHPNLWDVHPPFQIDGNFGATAGVAEMLIQSHAGTIDLLPALPDAWAKEGSFRGLCARGGYEVDCAWRDGVPTQVTVRSKLGTRPDVRFRGKPVAWTPGDRAALVRYDVSPTGLSLAAAVEKARTDGAAAHEIVLADGDYFLEKPIVLNARDSGLVIRAANDGKAVLWGGTVVSGWKKDGDRFYAAELPEVKAGRWDFRSLYVDGKTAERACYPSPTNQLENLGGWKEKLRAAIDGYWARKPTEAELTMMPYRKGDLPPGFEPRNADVRLYHMWSESFVNVVSNDAERGVLHFGSRMGYPAGAFNRRKYQVFGIREGLTHPGTWYLDRPAGKVVYWPKPGEDMAKVRVVAPRMETIISVCGSSKAPVKNVRLEGLVLTATATPCMSASFGGSGTPGALAVSRAEDCAFERLVIRHVGATGFRMGQAKRCRFAASSVTDCGSSAMCVYADATEIVSNRLLRVGLAFPSACSATIGGEGTRFANNEVAHSPYSGLILRGDGNVIEDNHISKVMQVLHDGAAVYGNMRRTTIRRNVVRDVVEVGSGYGASGFYCDETSTDNVIEDNVTIGVPTPCHQHISRNIHLRRNTFVTDGDMKISFANSVGCTFVDNVLVSGGKIVPTQACRTSVTNWSGNRACSVAKAGAPVAWGCALEPPAAEKPRAALKAPRCTGWKADGTLADGEYGSDCKLDRDAHGVYLGAAPTTVRVSRDDRALYVAFKTADFWTTPLSCGETEGRDESIRFTLNGRAFVAFYSGKVYALGADGSRTPLADAFCGEIRGGMARLHAVECRIPFAQLGVEPKPGAKVSFNASRYTSFYRETRWYSAPDAPAAVIEL